MTKIGQKMSLYKGLDMAKTDWPYTVSDMQHGKKRWFFRKLLEKTPDGKKRFKRVRLTWNGTPITQADENTERFRLAYEAAKAAFETEAPKVSKPQKGTLGDLIRQYQLDPASSWHELASRTQYVRSGILAKIDQDHGDKSAAGMTSRHVIAGRNQRKDTPAQANSIIKTLRVLYDYGIEAGVVTHNPARDVKLLKGNKDGFHTWSIEEQSIFEAKHPVGTMGRLAYDLLIYTGQRRSDVIRMGPNSIRADGIHVKQIKTGISLVIPLHPTLRETIAATETGETTFLITQFGKPFTDNGFGNFMRKRCDEAELNHCSSHGLRKAAASRLAEAGCTANEIMSITGHTTLKEVSRYTAEFERKKSAVRAMSKLQNEASANVIPLKRKEA